MGTGGSGALSGQPQVLVPHGGTQGWLCPARELGLLGAMAAAGGTTRAAVNKRDIWRGKDRQSRRCPLCQPCHLCVTQMPGQEKT